MKKLHLLVGLTILLWGTTVAVGQDRFGFAQCNPCEPVVDPCDPCGGKSGLFSALSFGGWVETGVYINGNGGKSDNGPVHTSSVRRTDFALTQLYFYGEKEMDTRRGFDWGARADFVYGTHAGSMQCYDGTFDAGWGENRHGYAMSVYNLYGSLGYKDLSVKVGKFTGLVGWESSASKDNFFYSRSLCYWIEPATHMGVLATYNLTDRLSIDAGWTTGTDTSFKNPDNGQSVLTGFTYALTDNANVYYYFNGGKQNNFFGLDDKRYNYFVQSLCYEWTPTKRFTYVFQYNLINGNERDDTGRPSAYGVNNHFLYELTDQWSAGMRFGWVRDNGGYFDDGLGPYLGDFYEVTLGLNWNPWENVSIRPEVRYDWFKGAGTPFGGSQWLDTPGTRKDQVSAGCGLVVSF